MDLLPILTLVIGGTLSLVSTTLFSIERMNRIQYTLSKRRLVKLKIEALKDNSDCIEIRYEDLTLEYPD